MSNYSRIMMKFQDRGTPQKISDVITRGFWDFFKYGFLGYKTNTRINELVKKGLIERCGTEIGKEGQHFGLYQLTEKGKDYRCDRKLFNFR